MKQISEPRIFFVELLLVVLSFVHVSARAAEVQSANAGSNCSALKLDIAVPGDVIRPQSNVLLDMKLTNVGHDRVGVPGGFPDFWSYEFELRDAQGALVQRTSEWMRAISQRPLTVTLNVSIGLAAGESLMKTVILNKLFDLSKPGRYTLRVSFDSFACGNAETRVTSNLILFTVGARSTTSQQGIAINLSAPRARVPVGWAVPLDLVIQNNSYHPLRWAFDDPPNIAPDEFSTGVEVFDAKDEVSPPPQPPDPNWSATRFRATVSTVEIPPGKSAEQIILIGDLFDISKPGEYRVKVALWDPIGNQRVESAPISFEIVDSTSSPSAPKQPPFVVTLSSAAHFERPNSNILICMSNISDQDIRLDNSASKDFISVEASDGTRPAIIAAQLKDWNPDNLKRIPANSIQSNTWDTVKARKALCGGLGVGAIYDLSKPGLYRVQVDRYDEPDAIPGQKLSDLPIVHSNWLTIFEKPQKTAEK